MNKASVLKELNKLHPGRLVICIPEDSDNPTEIICPLDNIEGGSRAVVVIDSTEPKYHKVSTERFTVLRGRLIIQTERNNSLGNRESEAKVLNAGDSFTVEPMTVYSLHGDETWLEADTFPAWSPEDDFPGT